MTSSPAVSDFAVTKSIDGGEALTVTPSAASVDATGTIVTLTVPEVVATAQDQSVVYSVSYNGGDAVAASAITVNALAVSSVNAITTTIDSNNNAVQLEFAINGQTTAADVTALTNAGYTVAFDSTDGNVSSAGIADGTQTAASFDYDVVINKDGNVVATSDPVTVTTVDYSAITTEITKADVTVNGVTNTSGKITTADSSITFANVQGTKKDGSKGVALTGETFKSSNPSVATVNLTTGAITPVSAGSVVFTITSDGVTKTVPMTVVTDARVATTAAADTSDVKLINNGTASIKLTVKDQYGDLFKGFDLAAFNVNNTATTPVAIVAVANPAATDATGVTTLALTADASNVGTGTLKVMSADGKTTLVSIPVTIGAAGTVSNRTLAITTDKADYSLDLNPLAQTFDKSFDIVWNQYNADGLLMGPEVDWVGNGASNPETYSIASSNTDVATVAVADDGTITVNEGTVTGTATISIKEGTLTRASFTVTVADSSPSITGVTFEQNIKMLGNETPAITTAVLKPANVQISGEGTVLSDGTNIFIDVTGGTAGTYDAGTDILLGTIQAVSNVTDAAGTTQRAVTITSGNLTVTSGAATDIGTIVIKVMPVTGTNPISVTTVTVGN